MFLTNRGSAMTRQCFWHLLKGYGKQVGLWQNLTLHVLRHSFATHLLERGGRAGVCAPLGFTDLFTAPRNAPDSDIAGCELMETPMGTQIRTNEAKETTRPGVFACGDAARVPHSISLAVGDGAWAGAQVHQSLVFPSAA